MRRQRSHARHPSAPRVDRDAKRNGMSQRGDREGAELRRLHSPGHIACPFHPGHLEYREPKLWLCSALLCSGQRGHGGAQRPSTTPGTERQTLSLQGTDPIGLIEGVKTQSLHCVA